MCSSGSLRVVGCGILEVHLGFGWGTSVICIHDRYCTYMVGTLMQTQGASDPELNRLARCGSGGRSQANCSRNLHKLMYREKRILPIKTSLVPTRVRLLKGKPKVETMEFPVLRPSSWVDYMMTNCSEILLGGFNIHSVPGWQRMLEDFWSKFQQSQPQVEVPHPRTSIPVAVHGDEGRGKAKRPIMCIGFQPLISYLGPAVTNTSGPTAEFSVSVVVWGLYKFRGFLVWVVGYGCLGARKLSEAQLCQSFLVHGCAERDVCQHNFGYTFADTSRRSAKSLPGRPRSHLSDHH